VNFTDSAPLLGGSAGLAYSYVFIGSGAIWTNFSLTYVCPQEHQVIYKNSFDTSASPVDWNGYGYDSTAQSLVLNGNSTITYCMPDSHLEKLRGCLLLASGNYTTNVPTLGIIDNVKLTVTVTTPSSTEDFKAGIFGGNLRPDYAVRVFVPLNATEMTLKMESTASDATGSLDDVKFTIRQVNAIVTTCEKTAALDRLPSPLRGSMVWPRKPFTTADAQDFGKNGWKGNLVRWQMRKNPNFPDDADYDAWLQDEISMLDAMLPTLIANNIAVVVDLHHPLGGSSSWATGDTTLPSSGLFKESIYQNKLIETWQILAEHYKGNKAIFGYDLANEPNDRHASAQESDIVGFDVYDWWELADRTAQAIRQIDPEIPIIYENSPGGMPCTFWKNLHPLTVRNVIYSIHMYMPYEFTHQGVPGTSHANDPVFAYNTSFLNSTWLNGQLYWVKMFQDKYNARIYVGEFSAVRWAGNVRDPSGSSSEASAHGYLRDVINIFESRDWDWSYHAFRENSCFSVEYDGSYSNKQLIQNINYDTPDRDKNRMELLLYQFKMNNQFLPLQ
jgi:hypothetical protein